MWHSQSLQPTIITITSALTGIFQINLCYLVSIGFLSSTLYYEMKPMETSGQMTFLWPTHSVTALNAISAQHAGKLFLPLLSSPHCPPVLWQCWPSNGDSSWLAKPAQFSLKVICNGFSQNWWKVVSSCLLQYKPVCVINVDKLRSKMLKSRSLVVSLV